MIHFQANISGANVVPTGSESPDNKYNVCCLSFVDLWSDPFVSENSGIYIPDAGIC